MEGRSPVRKDGVPILGRRPDHGDPGRKGRDPRLHEDYAQRRRAAIVEETLQRQTAELAAANQELEAFSYSVSHDLRAPLRAIDGFSQALLEESGDRLEENGKRYLQRVRAGAQKMAELIDDLLSLSRVSRQPLDGRLST